MPKRTTPSEVLTIRVPRDLARRLASEARRRRQTRSEVAREMLEAGFYGVRTDDPPAEARRQSLLVRDRESERDTLEWILDAADFRGWE